MSCYILLQAAVPETPEPKDIILCFLDHNNITPYATWVYDVKHDDAFGGHYFKTCEEALTDFIARCKGRNAVMYPTSEHRPK